MILEETSGNVTVTLEGKQVAVGTYFEDSMLPSVSVIGSGKATFRVDSSCTIDVKGVEEAAPVELKITAESTVKAVEAPVKTTVKAPAAE
jgi:hypothetical protein